MGIQPFLITATVEAILAQRLVRRICTQCREVAVPTTEMLQDLELTAADIAGKTFYRGKGCDACNSTGYKGRVGLFELMLMNDNLRDMIMKAASTNELRDAARGYGMVTLRDAGMSAAADGKTTLDEVIRETIMEA